MCATTAFKQAALNTMNYLTNLGYTLEQSYLLLSAAVSPPFQLTSRSFFNSERTQNRYVADTLSVSRLQPTEAHVAALVDVPNACVTLSLPPQIFDRNILPDGMGENGFEKRDYGQAALRSDSDKGCIDYFAEQAEKQKASKK